MVVGASVEEVLFCLGHDGSKILWPSLGEPLQRKAFHIEELQYVAFDMHWCLVPYYPAVNYCPDKSGNYDALDFVNRFRLALLKFDGILLGNYVGRPNQHAVAWNVKEQRIYDPSNHYASIQDFVPESFHAAVRT